MMKKAILAATITATLTLISFSANAENLIQVYQTAKRYDAQLKAQESNYLAVLENKPQALAGKKPQVNFSAGAAVNQQLDIRDSSDSTNFNANYSVGVTKSLYNRNLDAQIDKVDFVIAQAKTQLESQRQALIMRVADPYFNYLLAQENYDFSVTEKDAVKRQLDQVRAYFEAGRSAITDVREAESRYNLALSREITAKQNVNLAQENLRVLTGNQYQVLMGPQENMKLTVPAPRSMEAWVEIAKRSSLNLKIARQAIEVAQKEIEVQRSRRRNPTVNAYARQTGSFSETNTRLDPANAGASVGVEVNIPLYQGGAVASAIRQAQHQFRQAQQDYEYQARQIEQQVRNAYLEIESAISRVQAQRRALLSAQTAARATKVGFEVGTRTAVDVFTSLRDVFAAQRDYTKARYEYLLSTLKLRDAAGTLSERDVQQLSASLTKPYK